MTVQIILSVSSNQMGGVGRIIVTDLMFGCSWARCSCNTRLLAQWWTAMQHGGRKSPQRTTRSLPLRLSDTGSLHAPTARNLSLLLLRYANTPWSPAVPDLNYQLSSVSMKL